MWIKCVFCLVGKCDKDAEVIFNGSGYCMDHAKELAEEMGMGELDDEEEEDK